MTTILIAQKYLIRPFGGCTVEKGRRLLEEAWEYITRRNGGSTEQCPGSLYLPDECSGEPFPLLVYDEGDVSSQRGHVGLIREALEWFAQNGLGEGTIRECHPTQSDGKADLWIVTGEQHCICEATDKQSWENWCKRKINRGAGTGLTKRCHHIDKLSSLAVEIRCGSPTCIVKMFHILNSDIAERESKQDGCNLVEGSSVLVEFGNTVG